MYRVEPFITSMKISEEHIPTSMYKSDTYLPTEKSDGSGEKIVTQTSTTTTTIVNSSRKENNVPKVENEENLVKLEENLKELNLRLSSHICAIKNSLTGKIDFTTPIYDFVIHCPQPIPLSFQIIHQFLADQNLLSIEETKYHYLNEKPATISSSVNRWDFHGMTCRIMFILSENTESKLKFGKNEEVIGEGNICRYLDEMIVRKIMSMQNKENHIIHVKLSELYDLGNNGMRRFQSTNNLLSFIPFIRKMEEIYEKEQHPKWIIHQLDESEVNQLHVIDILCYSLLTFALQQFNQSSNKSELAKKSFKVNNEVRKWLKMCEHQKLIQKLIKK
ncbi:hypothetical protein SNEBB_003965 [Seison nebaliae]|nr:hypothetical protein SNEBB_003965 [Seison nebaliae]